MLLKNILQFQNNGVSPDIELSITPEKFKQMVNICNEIHSAKGIRNKILKEEIPVTNFAFATVVTTKEIFKE